jgi:hypothetical protein
VEDTMRRIFSFGEPTPSIFNHQHISAISIPFSTKLTVGHKKILQLTFKKNAKQVSWKQVDY